MRSYIEELDRLGELCRVDRPLARAAIALGLPPDSHGGTLVAAIAAALDRDPIPPVPVPKAPFQQNIRLGGDIDLTALPAPNAYGLTIVRTPDGGWTNWSIDSHAAARPQPAHRNLRRRPASGHDPPGVAGTR
ncbi:hypothetical protein AWN90_02915 [Nocardia terpenica]|uniref:Uncharacterized protein n=2 Tax=Nocardia terpenica TaxID=455432 RepID=A0A164KSS0_9NOCA|nr:hypothetical protein AWN90_02915 [Nocardia terpenica]